MSLGNFDTARLHLLYKDLLGLWFEQGDLVQGRLRTVLLRVTTTVGLLDLVSGVGQNPCIVPKRYPKILLIHETTRPCPQSERSGSRPVRHPRMLNLGLLEKHRQGEVGKIEGRRVLPSLWHTATS